MRAMKAALASADPMSNDDAKPDAPKHRAPRRRQIGTKEARGRVASAMSNLARISDEAAAKEHGIEIGRAASMTAACAEVDYNWRETLDRRYRAKLWSESEYHFGWGLTAFQAVIAAHKEAGLL